MIKVGNDLEGVLQTLGLTDHDFTWIIPRPAKLNREVKITGILVAGFLSHKIIGEALATNKNVILTSNLSLRFDQNSILETLGETLYKNDLFIIQWNYSWLMSNIQGDLIIAKIFGVPYEFLLKEKMGQYRIHYNSKVNCKSILQRFPDFLLFENSVNDQNFYVARLFVALTNEIETTQNFKDETFVTLIKFSELEKRKILKDFNTLIELQETDFLNEISREFYYLIKQGEELDIDLSFNKRIEYQKIKN